MVIRPDEQQPANRWVLWGFIIMFAGAGPGVVGKMLLHSDAVTAFGVLVSLLGMFLVVFPYLLPARRPKKNFDISSEPEPLIAAEPTMKLPPMNASDHIPSVIDNTTELLKEPAPNHSNSRR